MIGTRMLAFATVVGFAFAPPPLFAAPPQGEAQEMQNEGSPNRASIQAFENAKTSFDRAISAAESKANGKAIDATFQDTSGTPSYEVRVITSNDVWEGKVNASNGQVSGQGKTTPINQLDQEDMAEVHAAQNAKINLKQAAQKAEQNGGKVMQGGLEQRNGQVAYEFDVVKNGQIEMIDVNPQTGQIAMAEPGSREKAMLRGGGPNER